MFEIEIEVKKACTSQTGLEMGKKIKDFLTDRVCSPPLFDEQTVDFCRYATGPCTPCLIVCVCVCHWTGDEQERSEGWLLLCHPRSPPLCEIA